MTVLARLASCAALVLLLAPSAVRAELLAEIRARGTLKVATAELSPWVVRDAAGELVGLEVDLARRLAADLGVGLDLVAVPFDALVDRLAAREVDVVAANLSITPARALRVAFSRPYDSSRIRPVVRTDRLPAEIEVDGLNADSVKLGVVAGTTAADVAAERFPLAETTEFPTQAELLTALLEGPLAGAVVSSPLPQRLAAEHPDRLRVLEGDPLRSTVEALAVPQGEPVFLTFLDNWLEALAAEGFIAASRRQWLGEESAESMP